MLSLSIIMLRELLELGFDGAHYSKKRSVVNLTIAFCFFGSLSHSPVFNFDLAKYLGKEELEAFVHCFGPVMRNAKDLEGKVVSLEIENHGTLSFIFDYFVV